MNKIKKIIVVVALIIAAPFGFLSVFGWLFGIGNPLNPLSVIAWFETRLHPDQQTSYTCSNGVMLTIDTHSHWVPWKFELGSGYVAKVSDLTFALGNKNVHLSTEKDMNGLGYGFGYPIDTIFALSPEAQRFLTNVDIEQPGERKVVYDGFTVGSSQASTKETKSIAGCLRQYKQEILFGPNLGPQLKSEVGFVMHFWGPLDTYESQRPPDGYPPHVFMCPRNVTIKIGGIQYPNEVKYFIGNQWSDVAKVLLDGTLSIYQPVSHIQQDNLARKDFTKVDPVSCKDAAGITLPKFLAQTAPKIILIQQ